MAKAALALRDHQDVVFATSAGGYTSDERPEIALVVAIDCDAATLLPAIESALAAEGLSVKAHLQCDVRYYEFGSTELLNIAEATKVADLQGARDMLDELAALPLQPISTERPDIAGVLRSITGATAESAADVPPSQISEGFSVTKARFDRLKIARGDAVKEELTGLTNTFSSLQKEHNTNAATTTMVASGLVTIGGAMLKLYTAVQYAGSITALVSSLLAAVGGIAGVGAIITAIAVLFGLA